MVIKAVLRAFVVEIELIGRATVIGRRVRDKALRVVDVAETGQVYAGGVDGGGKVTTSWPARKVLPLSASAPLTV